MAVLPFLYGLSSLAYPIGEFLGSQNDPLRAARNKIGYGTRMRESMRAAAPTGAGPDTTWGDVGSAISRAMNTMNASAMSRGAPAQPPGRGIGSDAVAGGPGPGPFEGAPAVTPPQGMHMLSRDAPTSPPWVLGMNLGGPGGERAAPAAPPADMGGYSSSQVPRTAPPSPSVPMPTPRPAAAPTENPATPDDLPWYVRNAYLQREGPGGAYLNPELAARAGGNPGLASRFFSLAFGG